MNEFAGYSLFKDVRSPILRAWNRLNVIYNIKELIRNNAMSVSYFKIFNNADQKRIYGLAFRVKKEGYENVRRELIRNLRKHYV